LKPSKNTAPIPTANKLNNMYERCPLFGGRQSIESLPQFCVKQCIELWEAALRGQAGDVDDYNAPAEGCTHRNVVFSHEALQSLDNSADRLYTIVDKCEDCETELLETTYSFQCEQN
jgi:hypothetical protein